eukprot:2789623-Rhodomonas_salina.1
MLLTRRVRQVFDPHTNSWAIASDAVMPSRMAHFGMAVLHGPPSSQQALAYAQSISPLGPTSEQECGRVQTHLEQSSMDASESSSVNMLGVKCPVFHLIAAPFSAPRLRFPTLVQPSAAAELDLDFI